VGPHLLPAINLNAQGLHLFELTIAPVILPEDVSDQSIQVVKSASSNRFWFGTDVYGTDSLFQSLVCSFQPTDAQQFVVKSVFLDCPLLTVTEWVGEWAAGTAIPYVLLVVEVANLICDFMEGKILNVASTMSAKYLTRLDDLRKAGKIVLTEREMRLLKRGLIAKSIKTLYDTYNDSVKHFHPQDTQTFGLTQPEALASGEEWPESLSLEEFRHFLTQMTAGFMFGQDMRGWECVAVLSDGQVTFEEAPGDLLRLGGEEVNVYLFPSGAGFLSVLSNEAVNIFRIQSILNNLVSLSHYSITSTGRPTRLALDLAKDGTLLIDQGADGTIEDFLKPETKAFALPSPLSGVLLLLLE
jgi:hypothetical protein